MALIKIPKEMGSTPGIVDNSNATAITIDSSENVGIGNSSAVGKLEVYANNTVSAAYIRQDGTGPIQSWHIAGGAEKMRLESSGNVGIGTGTDSPLVKLDVRGSASAPASSGTAQTGSLRVSQTVGTGVLDMGFYTSSNGTAWLQSTNKANLAINYDIALQPNGGNVGIGTTSPDTKLEVKGTSATPSATAQILSVTNTTGGTRLDLGVAENSYGWIQAREGSTLRNLLLNSAGGNVGIGTTSPANPLSISVQTHGLYSQHRPSNGNGTGQEMYYKFNTADGTPEIFSSIYSEIESNANGAESGKIALRAAKAGSLTTGLMLIGSTGNVGIGTVTPDAKLSVGVGTAADGIKFDVSYSPVNSLPRGTIAWDDGNASNALTGQIDTRYNGTTVDMHFGSLYNSGYNATSRLIIKGNGNVEIPDGNLSFASGHGIDFSASANYSASSSELLYDYEEGLWYPYLGTDTQLGSASSANYNNKYVKIGRLVHCTGWFNAWNYANVTSGTYMMIKNLPFPPEHHSTGLRLSYTSNLGGSTYGYGHTSHNAFYLLIGGSTGAATHYTRAAAPGSGTAHAMLNIVYYTAS